MHKITFQTFLSGTPARDYIFVGSKVAAEHKTYEEAYNEGKLKAIGVSNFQIIVLCIFFNQFLNQISSSFRLVHGIPPVFCIFKSLL